MTATTQTLLRHRRVWAAKPTLREIYRAYFRRMMRLCSRYRPIVEIGCGAGMLRECYPEIITTDILTTRWADLVCSGDQLPFANGSLGNLVMIDVFHHMGDPHRVLKEASRVLRPGGRLVMLEPWTSPAGYLFYRYIHHEGADYRVNLNRPFGKRKDAFDGNATLPRLYFALPGRVTSDYLNRLSLDVKTIEPLPAINWLITGGFHRHGVRHRRLLPLLNAVDSMFAPLRKLTALRAFIVVQRLAS